MVESNFYYFLCKFKAPGRDFSEEYHVEVLKKTHEAFDELRKNKMIAGEMIWNFADFMTAQG